MNHFVIFLENLCSYKNVKRIIDSSLYVLFFPRLLLLILMVTTSYHDSSEVDFEASIIYQCFSDLFVRGVPLLVDDVSHLNAQNLETS